MRLKFPLSILATSLLLVSCNESSDDDNSTTSDTSMDSSSAHIRVLHASSDAPAVNVKLNGNVALSDVDYGVSSGLIELDAASYDIAVEGITSNSLVEVINAPGQTLGADTIYEIVATGDLSTIKPVIVARDTNFDSSKARVSILHAADDAPQVDIHVTSPNAPLSAETVAASLSFSENTESLELAAGDYHVRLTTKDNPDNVVYDSGVLPLGSGSDYFISALENTQITSATANKSPVMLAISQDDQAAELLYSQTDGADLRVIHNSADAPAVDVVVNDTFSAPLISNLAFTEASDYINVAQDNYNVKVGAAGSEAVVSNADLDLNNATVYSVFAVNTLDNIEPLILTDNPRVLATDAKVRIIHGSTLAGTVDVYVSAVGANINDMQPTLSDVSFKQDSGYLTLEAGEYEVTVTAANSKTAAIGPQTISVSINEVYNFIATDNTTLDNVQLISY